MLSNPLRRVVLGDKALNYFRFPIRPENINTPPTSGIFPCQERWLLFKHLVTMRVWTLVTSQLSCRIGQKKARHSLAIASVRPGKVVSGLALRTDV
ncbi:hypothetical protein ACVIYL_001601 [Bradyrhizobium sp. USDA 3315]